MSVELITMERFVHREKVQLGIIPQRSLISSNPSSTTPLTSSDVDFHDVFGGPPRRLSMNEVRCSFNETTGSNALRGEEEETLSYSRRWSGLIERPVFGEETVNRRILPSQDFFDDVFRGDESVSSTPRRSEHRDPFSLTPGSRVLSPALPLPPRAEFLGSPSSLPPQFSLSSKSVKGMDFPAMASVTGSPSRKKDGASSGISSPYSPSTSMSRFSSPAIQGQDECRNNVWPSYRQSPLSHKFSLSSEESAKVTKSDKTNAGGNLKKDLNSSDGPTNSGQFHFSIYKWASKGVPLMMPLRGGKSSRLKEKNIKRSWSCNAKVEDESMIIESTTATLSGTEFPSLNNSVSAHAVSCGVKCKKQDDESLLNTSTQEKLEPFQTDWEAVLAKCESEPLNSLQTTAKDIPGNTILCNTREETNPHSLPDISLCGKTEEEISVVTKEACKPELKTLHSLLSNSNDEQGKDEIPGEVGRKESMVKTTKKSTGNVNVDKSVKQKDGKRNILNGAEVDKASFQGSPVNTRDNPGRNKIKGRVKEFIQIFNQEAPSKPIINVETRNPSSRLKGAGSFRAEKVESVSTKRTNENMDMPNVDKKMTSTNVSVKADECFKPLEKQHSGIDTTIHIFSDSSSGQKDRSSSSNASTPDGSETIIGNIDDSFQGNFLVKELSEELNKLSQTSEDQDEFQVSDAKIQKWSNGKEGNIRSLLSTLQYILWPESGWKPVPLVDIIEGNAVKRAYQKALLCLHPDKLQQKGAAAHQKYIAEKVFEILQEAWIHFNSLGSL